ncbi:MAG: ABC transporter ATP-binding protein [Arenicellales bacterium]|jgi:branched-chain amino acid transport system ATP-binding protein|nr:ABC transporter ATP-binding protein [Arenicellales bacterium]
MGESVILGIRDLYKSFGGVAAINGLTLDVLEREVHAVIGPNGAGKTTLVSQLTGVGLPDAGQVVFRGRDITWMPAYRRSHLGMARSFQITSIIHDMTVLENVVLAVQAKAGHSYRFWESAIVDDQLTEPAIRALTQVGLEAEAMQIAGPLSHGEHRQLELAMVLATDPELVFLDEPTAGMGLEDSTRMVSMLESLKGSRTIILVEHDMDAVFALADRITVMVEGRAIATGTPDVIRADRLVREAYLGEDMNTAVK